MPPQNQPHKPDLWVLMLVLVSGLVAFLIKAVGGLEFSLWAIGMLTFSVLAIPWSMAYARGEAERTTKLLEDIPPGERLAALDEMLGGAISKMENTPEYKKTEDDVRKRMKKIGERLESLHTAHESTTPLNENQLADEFKKEMDIHLYSPKD